MNEEILESVFQVANEPEKLIEIHEQNPELAQKILTKMGITIEQYQVEKL
ncbi:MAG: hypothetical protein LBU27_06905 [Candidatus Peribacteria bacterium]|jgi:hypothetical protein|nr:hypothetical protein [Candidatus Peribacteria bacterium]